LKIIEQDVKLLSMTKNPLILIEKAARICYKSDCKMDCDCEQEINPCEKCLNRASIFIQGIIKRGHESVIEHANASFLFITDRAIANEIVRHRLASYSQESTRYCNYGKSNEIVVIKPFVENEDQLNDWIKSVEYSEKSYLNMIENNTQPQHARSVLPLSLKTEIVITANFREWRHILKLRLSKSAHPQIRQLMQKVLNIFMQDQSYIMFNDIFI